MLDAPQTPRGDPGRKEKGRPEGNPDPGGREGRKRPPQGKKPRTKEKHKVRTSISSVTAPLSPSEPWNLQKHPLDREGDYGPPGFADNGAPLLGARGQPAKATKLEKGE